MSQLMIDSIGVGLAANQVGVLHRLLVYPRPPAVPGFRPRQPGDRMWWAMSWRRSRRGASVSQRPRRRRATGEHRGPRAQRYGEPQRIEASGLEARVIQHEIDHLDGVLVLDRVSRSQRKEAMRALREALAVGLSAVCARSISAPRSSPLTSCASWRRRPTGGRWWSRAPTARAAVGASSPRRPCSRPPASSASTPISRRRSTDEPARERIAAAAPDVVWCARSGRSSRSRCSPRIRSSTSTRPCCPAGEAPPRSSGPSWPVTSAPACASCASPPAWTAGRCA